ncbi:hypothetical protein NC99_33680 [Sunxiuqinia dokdonensis]|uniref:Uncharacterized protein n=1 Tax=Sunxiuqinia dokdonensis TaxID=1409788 RepID=A0A0L8V6P3_9BACT|nr:hypothetical protein NC99_33680 [Sunxiuqinia dokdonensis]
MTADFLKFGKSCCPAIEFISIALAKRLVAVVHRKAFPAGLKD